LILYSRQAVVRVILNILGWIPTICHVARAVLFFAGEKQWEPTQDEFVESLNGKFMEYFQYFPMSEFTYKNT
jgi:hypothetical protein